MMVDESPPPPDRCKSRFVEPEFVRGIALGLVIGSIVMFQEGSVLMFGVVVGVALILNVFEQYLYYIR